jgi:hypothetical protein
MHKIIVDFAVDVELTDEQHFQLSNLIEEIARANTPEGHVHWLFSQGSMPNFSRADRAFLGMEDDPDATERGEPTFNDDILHFGTSCREKH